MVAISSKEVKAIAALLQEGAETPEHLAKACIEKLDETRASKGGYCIITEIAIENTTAFNVFGPFNTQHQAKKTVEKGLIPEISLGAQWRWGRLYSEPYLRARMARVDELREPPTVTTVKGRPVVADPHMEGVQQIKVLNQKSGEWRKVYGK